MTILSGSAPRAVAQCSWDRGARSPGLPPPPSVTPAAPRNSARAQPAKPRPATSRIPRMPPAARVGSGMWAAGGCLRWAELGWLTGQALQA